MLTAKTLFLAVALVEHSMVQGRLHDENSASRFHFFKTVAFKMASLIAFSRRRAVKAALQGLIKHLLDRRIAHSCVSPAILLCFARDQREFVEHKRVANAWVLFRDAVYLSQRKSECNTSQIQRRSGSDVHCKTSCLGRWIS